MNLYNEYKPSEIEWIGDIPSHWKLKRIKTNFYLKGRIGWQELKADEFTDEGVHCVTGTDFKNGIVNWDSCYRVSDERYEVDANIQLFENDLLITKDGTIGKVALVKNMPGKATLNSGIFLLRPLKRIFLNDFIYWVLNSSSLIEFNNYTKTGATISHLYQNVFERMSFCVPSISEQKAVVNYLEKEIHILDRIIYNKATQIEKLKELRQIEINNAVTRGLNPNVDLKESNIEWIGKIPKHWAYGRLKIFGKIIGGFAFPSSNFTENGIIVLKINNIQTMWIDWSELDFIPETKLMNYHEYIVENGDLIFALTRPIISTGIKAAILSNTSSPVLINQRTAVFRPQKNIITRFLYFITMSDYFYQDFRSRIKITNQPNISTDDIACIKIVIPSIEEQIEIAKYLEVRLSKIDTLIANIEKQIEKLEELRKIKIHEAVTGKIKVT
jgi:type I restriction enzyme S subunit